ncbi:MAG: HNH endonuclease [Bdellovibrionaceae bacterium]|nr:HNH endonuclease [Pseudobdellovibrionaceae bacterium]
MYFNSVDPKQVAREKQKARELRTSQWWKQQLAQGTCYYCEGKFSSQELTMDHKIPLSRGGKSTKGNVVPACKECNNKKKNHTPVDLILEQKIFANDEE